MSHKIVTEKEIWNIEPPVVDNSPARVISCVWNDMYYIIYIIHIIYIYFYLLCSFQIYVRSFVKDYPLLLPDTFCGNVNNPIATASHFLNFLCSLRQIEFYEFPGGQSHIFIAQIELQPRPELEYGSHVDIRVVERREI